MQTQKIYMEAHTSVKWCRQIIILWVDKNVLIELSVCVCVCLHLPNIQLYSANEKNGAFCRLLFIWLQIIDLFKLS